MVGPGGVAYRAVFQKITDFVCIRLRSQKNSQNNVLDFYLVILYLPTSPFLQFFWGGGFGLGCHAHFLSEFFLAFT